MTLINELNLVWKYRERGTLGDGSFALFDVYEAKIIWHGKYQEIEVNAAETEPLIGMLMLKGNHLQVEIVDGGLVTIEKCSSSKNLN
jgi:predicted aspartyl protease